MCFFQVVDATGVGEYFFHAADTTAVQVCSFQAVEKRAVSYATAKATAVRLCSSLDPLQLLKQELSFLLFLHYLYIYSHHAKQKSEVRIYCTYARHLGQKRLSKFNSKVDSSLFRVWFTGPSESWLIILKTNDRRSTYCTVVRQSVRSAVPVLNHWNFKLLWSNSFL
jgi:hypothetical protein